MNDKEKLDLINKDIEQFANDEGIDLNPPEKYCLRAILWAIATREYGEARMLPETELDKNVWTSQVHNVIEHYLEEITNGRATTEDFRIHIRAGIEAENMEEIR